MTNTSPRTVLLGRLASTWATRIADQLGPRHGLRPEWLAETIIDALHQLDGEVPDLVIVLQDTPDQFPPEDIRQLLSTCPLARLVVCYGPWCRGDGRNRDNWPLAVRVPHTAATSRLDTECRVLSGRDTGLPWTAARTEIAASQYRARQHPNNTVFRFHIVSPDMAWSRTLTDQLACLGGLWVALPHADLLLLDIDPWDADSICDYGAVLQTTSAQIAVLLTNLPDNLSTSSVKQIDSRRPIVVRDKLEAAARPDDLVGLLPAPPTRRSA